MFPVKTTIIASDLTGNKMNPFDCPGARVLARLLAETSMDITNRSWMMKTGLFTEKMTSETSATSMIYSDVDMMNVKIGDEVTLSLNRIE
jgi:hypothetical protein